jgi:hypothetical protein
MGAGAVRNNLGIHSRSPAGGRAKRLAKTFKAGNKEAPPLYFYQAGASRCAGFGF